MCDHKYQRGGLQKGKKCTLSGNTSSSLIVANVWGRIKHSRSINKTRNNSKLWYISSALCLVLHIVSGVGGKILLNKRNVRSVERVRRGSGCDATHEPVTVPIKLRWLGDAYLLLCSARGRRCRRLDIRWERCRTHEYFSAVLNHSVARSRRLPLHPNRASDCAFNEPSNRSCLFRSWNCRTFMREQGLRSLVGTFHCSLNSRVRFRSLNKSAKFWKSKRDDMTAKAARALIWRGSDCALVLLLEKGAFGKIRFQSRHLLRRQRS